MKTYIASHGFVDSFIAHGVHYNADQEFKLYSDYDYYSRLRTTQASLRYLTDPEEKNLYFIFRLYQNFKTFSFLDFFLI
jgi:hypothetical protein